MQPLSPTSSSDILRTCSSPTTTLIDNKDMLGLRGAISPSHRSHIVSSCTTPPGSCTAAPASSTVSPHSPNSSTDSITGKAKKKRKPRTCFSVGQMLVLENTFQQTKYVSITDRGKLAGSLGLTDSQIKVWFQNRRSKWRKTMDSKMQDHGNSMRQMTHCPEQGPVGQHYFWPNAEYLPTGHNNNEVYNGFQRPEYHHMVG